MVTYMIFMTIARFREFDFGANSQVLKVQQSFLIRKLNNYKANQMFDIFHKI